MYVVVYDGEQQFAAAFKDGKLVRATPSCPISEVAGTLFMSAVAVATPGAIIKFSGAAVPAAAEGDSDFGTPDAPGA